AKKAKSQPTSSTLSLSGIAQDDAAVTRFVSSLREAGVFDQVDLKASSQVAGEDGGRQYQLECRYQDMP
ncbi:MAG: PilN domain-containing protein, partial [Aureliella sp.]